MERRWLPTVLLLAVSLALIGAACGSSTATQPASGLKRVVVGDLSVRVPAEWQSYDYEPGSGWKGVSLADPRHEPSDAVIFGFYSQEEPDTTFVQMAYELADEVSAAGAAAEQQLVFLPSGIPAYEVRLDRAKLEDRTFLVLGYALLIRDSSSGTRGYRILYRAIDSQAGHMAQFRTSARSIRAQPAAAAGLHASTLTRREKVWIRTLFPLLLGITDAGNEIATALSHPAGLVNGGQAHRQMDAALATFEKCAPTLKGNGPAPTTRLRPVRSELATACVHFGRGATSLARVIDKIDAAPLDRASVELNSALGHYLRATRSLDVLLRR